MLRSNIKELGITQAVALQGSQGLAKHRMAACAQGVWDTCHECLKTKETCAHVCSPSSAGMGKRASISRKGTVTDLFALHPNQQGLPSLELRYI